MTPKVKQPTSWILVTDVHCAQLWACHRKGQVSALGVIRPQLVPLSLLQRPPARPTIRDRPVTTAPDLGRISGGDATSRPECNPLAPANRQQGITDPQPDKCADFARQLAQYLDSCARWNEFQRLVLIAPTGMLQALHENLSVALRMMVGAEIDQDLTRGTKGDIQTQLRSLAID